MSIPRVVLKPRRARPFFGRHPWVFAGAIQRVEDGAGQSVPDLQAGAVVDLVTDRGEFVARGLWNAASNIQCRLYSWEQDSEFNHTFWDERIANAVELRRRMFEFRDDTACRLIFSEADGLSGLTVDKYGDWLLVQFTSKALHSFSQSIISSLQNRLQPKGIWLRTEKGMLENEQLELSDGLIAGEPPPRPLFITERDIQFGIDVHEGQKTGFFLDQSANRQRVAAMCKGHRVLDLFCYSGGFSITCAGQGAKTTLGIDSSESAITAARANADLNGLGGTCRFEKSDVGSALKQLKEEGRMFDTVIVDPPKMARSRRGIEKALKGYLRYNLAALDVLEPGGLLVTCSCSGHVSRQDFEDMLAALAEKSRRTIQILESHGASADHPVSASCPESAYLKCHICRL